MLEHIPALLTPDAPHALASMGHGDAVAIVDVLLAKGIVREAG